MLKAIARVTIRPKPGCACQSPFGGKFAPRLDDTRLLS